MVPKKIRNGNINGNSMSYSQYDRFVMLKNLTTRRLNFFFTLDHNVTTIELFIGKFV